MRKICVYLSKGGVGKSTTSVSLAHGLALRGKKVLLVDTDDQGLDPGQDAFLLGVKPDHGLSDLINGNCSADEAIFEARKNLYLLAGGKSLSAVKREIGRKDFGAEKTLQEALAPYENKFDYVILDTSPAWDSLTINAMFYSQEILTPVSLEAMSINSLLGFNDRVASVQKYNEKLSHRYVLPTFQDNRVKKSSEILSQLKKHFSSQICFPIKYNVRLSEAPGFGQTIFEFAPESPGAKGYKKVIQRILKDDK